jgi:lycopene cyclase domain-containing protein
MSEFPLYLLLDVVCLAAPLAFSFDRRTRFYLRWKRLFIGMLLMWAVFLPWDIAFTERGIWGFNPAYLVGLDLWGLPVEEWLFFLCVPYACAFSYVSVSYYFPRDPWARAVPFLTAGVLLVSVGLLAAFPDRAYTAMTALLTIVALLVLHIWIKPAWMGRFFLTYAFVVVPFLVINGVLTGVAFWQYPLFNFHPETITDPIVWYNNDHNTGLRIFTVPADDFLYSFLMQLLVVAGLEGRKAENAM